MWKHSFLLVPVILLIQNDRCWMWSYFIKTNTAVTNNHFLKVICFYYYRTVANFNFLVTYDKEIFNSFSFFLILVRLFNSSCHVPLTKWWDYSSSKVQVIVSVSRVVDLDSEKAFSRLSGYWRVSFRSYRKILEESHYFLLLNERFRPVVIIKLVQWNQQFQQ